jgi:type III restriction enzyme
VSGWLKDELARYEVNERFEDESYFERLNAPDSDVNILTGSRSFYEGWDPESGRQHTEYSTQAVPELLY